LLFYTRCLQFVQDLCDDDRPFGGKIFLAAGDFRQTLPVMPREYRPAIVSMTFKKWMHWPQVACPLPSYSGSINSRQIRRLHLTENMRVKSLGGSAEYADYLLSVGEGRVPTLQSASNADYIALKDEMCVDSLSDLIAHTFPDLAEGKNIDGRAILTPINDDVDEVNNHITALFPGEEHVYFSVDKLEECEGTSCSIIQSHIICSGRRVRRAGRGAQQPDAVGHAKPRAATEGRQSRHPPAQSERQAGSVQWHAHDLPPVREARDPVRNQERLSSGQHGAHPPHQTLPLQQQQHALLILPQAVPRQGSPLPIYSD